MADDRRTAEKGRGGRGAALRGRVLVAAAALVVAGPLGRAPGKDADYERAPINYLTAPVDDPVARLQARLSGGEAELEYDPQQGYLPAVLEALGASPASQVLVFSKTSFQQ